MFEIFWQQWQSLVEELPVECTTSSFILSSVGKVLKVNDINERTHHCLVVLGYRLCTITTVYKIDMKQTDSGITGHLLTLYRTQGTTPNCVTL